jgi:hypothetical protein
VFGGKTEGFIQKASTVAQANATKTAAEIKEAKGASGFIAASKLMGVQGGATMAFLNERAASKDLAAKENAAYEKSGMTGDTLLSSGKQAFYPINTCILFAFALLFMYLCLVVVKGSPV